MNSSSGALKSLPILTLKLIVLTITRMCNKSIGPDQVDRLKAFNPDFKAMSSVYSSYCCLEKPDFHTYEKKSRQGLSIYKFLTLPKASPARQSTHGHKAVLLNELGHLSSRMMVKGAETSNNLNL